MFSGIIETTCPVVGVDEGHGSRRLVLDLAGLLAGLLAGDPAGEPGTDGDDRMEPASSAARTSDSDPAGGLAGGGAPPELGDSIAVNGVCLTVATIAGSHHAFDVVTETLERSNLGALQVGSRVNVERALRYGQRVDGHLVQGHVETTGEVRSVTEMPGQTWFTLACGADFARRCLPKGSVALDGVSLTVAELGADTLSVALVPHTLGRTTLGTRRPGDRVNLEPDMLGQWVLAHLARGGR